jgi:hypothetical protein
MYRPENPPVEVEQLSNYVYQELTRLSGIMELALARRVEFITVAPSKPREGMVLGADGTHWNPGAGKGIYGYYSGTWNKLG